jgi:glycine betaine catabolism B
VTLTLSIREVIPATPRARIVRIDLGDHAFPYAAGQALLIANHDYERRRPYSIAGAPEDARRERCLELLVGVNAEGAAGAHLTLEAGQAVDVDGPLGAFTFPPNPAESCFVFIAGGTGIAPLRAMMRHALAVPHRNIGLFYSVRTPDEFAFERELRGLADAGEIELRQTVTRAGDRDWSGARGRLDRAMLSELVHDPETLCFVCGPPALVDEMPKLLVEMGIPRERIRIEEWG